MKVWGDGGRRKGLAAVVVVQRVRMAVAVMDV